MLPLLTEATIEAMNVSTDRRHPFHTCNDRKWFRQFWFTHQNIVVDIDDMERDMEISSGKGSLRHWCLGYSQYLSVISTFWYISLILQYKQTYLFLSYFSSPVIRILRSLRSIDYSRVIDVLVTPLHSRFPCFSPRRLCRLRCFVVWIQMVWIDCGCYRYGRDGVGP